MTNTFQDYAKYYDLLYKDKDYAKEANYILEKIKNCDSILELGCGTGNHAKLLQDKGLDIYGIDLSENMIQRAKAKGINCEVADVRYFRQNKQYDAVISLFHIASYQNSDDDIKNYFNTAAYHLKKGGRFVFDVWYKPAVLYQKPQARIKTMENEEIKVVRHCTPEFLIDKSIVKVNYDIEIFNKTNNNTTNVKETHSMRFFSSDEIAVFAKAAGINIIAEEEWLTKNTPSKETWGVCFVGEKV